MRGLSAARQGQAGCVLVANGIAGGLAAIAGCLVLADTLATRPTAAAGVFEGSALLLGASLLLGGAAHAGLAVRAGRPIPLIAVAIATCGACVAPALYAVFVVCAVTGVRLGAPSGHGASAAALLMIVAFVDVASLDAEPRAEPTGPEDEVPPPPEPPGAPRTGDPDPDRRRAR